MHDEQTHTGAQREKVIIQRQCDTFKRSLKHPQNDESK